MTKLEFELDGNKYYVRMPSQREVNDGDLIYKTKYSEALRYGALTAAEADKIIKERELWTIEDDAEVQKMFVNLSALGEKLMETEKFVDAATIIYDMELARHDILRLNMRKNTVLDNTAESYADDHRLQFYCTACAFDDSDRTIYKNSDDYLNRAEEPLARSVITKMIHLMANGGKDFRSDWPEFQWRLKHGIIDENLEPIPEKLDAFIEEASKDVTKTLSTVKRKSKKSGKVTAKVTKRKRKVTKS